MMKKMLALLLVLCLPVTALAESVTANAVVESRKVAHITAHASGVLTPFEWETGDLVASDDCLFVLDTFKVCAPVEGTVRALFAAEGEQASDAMNEYGMLASIQKTQSQVIDASTTGAYNDPDNRWVHAGETVYFEQTTDRDNKGAGRIISVSGKAYRVEITRGDFDDGDSVKLYREDNMSTKTCVGTGKVANAPDVPVVGNGYVVRCKVQEGQQVKKGDVLFEMLNPDAENLAGLPEVAAGADGVLEVCTASGAQVYKGQQLAKVHGLQEMCVVASVDEMDLDCVQVGGSVTIAFDRYPDEMVVGTVREIGALGVTRQNAAYYDVTIDYYSTLQTLPGMNATVYLTK